MDQRALRDALTARADETRERLVAEWGDVPRRSRRIETPEYDAPTSPADLFPWVAVCFVVRDGDVLAIRDENHALDWEPPGGKGETGEMPAETAEREVREETGIDCEVKRLLATDTLRFDYGDRPLRPVEQAVFLADYVDGTLDTEPGIEAAWLSVDDIPDELQYADVV